MMVFLILHSLYVSCSSSMVNGEFKNYLFRSQTFLQTAWPEAVYTKVELNSSVSYIAGFNSSVCCCFGIVSFCFSNCIILLFQFCLYVASNKCRLKINATDPKLVTCLSFVRCLVYSCLVYRSARLFVSL